MRAHGRSAGILIAVWILLISFGHAQQVALTFDDLPSHGDLPPGMTRVEVAQKILAILKAHHVPQVYGFVNGAKVEKVPADKEVLTLWTAAGYPLGNHSWTHMQIEDHTVAEYEADIAANEPLLKELMPAGDWHWFRYPFLLEGNTPEKHAAVRTYLQEHGYKIAQITLDFHDYGWNGPYARCTAKNDAAALQWLQDSYLASANTYIDLGQQTARMLFGHDIKHVMLLHIGAFETVMLPRLLDLLEKRGFKFVTLEEAQSDPIYQLHPEPLTDWDGPLIEQLAAARKMKLPAHEEWPEEKLMGMCR